MAPKTAAGLKKNTSFRVGHSSPEICLGSQNHLLGMQMWKLANLGSHVFELRFPYVVSGPSFCYFPLVITFPICWLINGEVNPVSEPIGNDDAGHTKLASFFLRQDMFVFWCLLHDPKEVPSGKLT
jgi:hypothetical protein